ncbi:hypothetical protein KCP71_10685 [Salmonella enterica subsp. enterica]|nr:hypothetical protein KCP71_10685 [Salmonella enterica subsp. enterica]
MKASHQLARDTKPGSNGDDDIRPEARNGVRRRDGCSEMTAWGKVLTGAVD